MSYSAMQKRQNNEASRFSSGLDLSDSDGNTIQ